MDFEKFEGYCAKGICLRKTLKSKKCDTVYKKETCFEKYNRQKEKDSNKRITVLRKAKETKEIQKDELWEKVKEVVWLRDAKFYHGSSTLSKHNEWKKYCRVWKCFSREEKLECSRNLKDSFWLNKTLDVAHIIPRSQSKKLYYVLDNLLLMGNLFHHLLDTYKSPITGKAINKDERTYWFDRIKSRRIEE